MPQLPAIRRITSVSDGPRVTTDNSAEATYATDGDGRTWIRKSETLAGFQTILAEAVSWQLATELAVPVPDAAVIDIPNERSWLSAQVQPVLHWSPEHIPDVENLNDIGCLLALNVFLHNEDCHRGNVLLEATGTEFRLHAIDFGNSLVGYIQDYAARVDEPTSVHNLFPGIPVDLVEAQALETAGEIADLDDDLLKHIVREACLVVQETNQAQLLRAMIKRKQLALKLTREYLNSIRSF